MARELQLPVVCHCRQAEDEVLAALLQWPHLTRIWHCFDGTPEHARAAAEAGVWVSVGGNITYPDSARRHAAVQALPLESLLLETDAPYLAPYAPDGTRARDNEPAYLPLIAARVAELKGESVETIAAVTTQNATRVFRLNPGG